MAFAEDLTAFFNSSDFAVEATFRGRPVTVILDSQYDEVDVGRVGVQAARLRAFAVSADVADAVHGDALLIGPATYKVMGVQPDAHEAGPGITLLVLERG